MKQPKLSNKAKHHIIVLISSLLSAGFSIIVLLLLHASGKATIDIQHPLIFFLVTFLLSFLLGFLVIFIYERKKTMDMKQIYVAAENILSGKYDSKIEVELLDKEYRPIAVSLNKVAQKMKDFEQSKDDFINDFSHELKTPIASIRGFAKLLMDSSISDDEKREYSEIIFNESNRLVNLTTNTLMLNRLTTGNFEPDIKNFNLTELVRKCVLELQSEWEKKNLDIDLEGEEVFLSSNEDLVRQMILNIFSNSIKFSNPNGKIFFTIVSKNKNTILSIKDMGIGMNEDTLAHMFDKYYRGDKSRTVPGNGLGLSTVKKISEILSINITATSTPFEGTTIRLLFKQ